jgi:hypothetical protein
MKRIALGGFVLLAGLAVACSDSNGPEDNRCEEAVSIQAGSGTTPSIGWTPVCTVAQLRVVEAATDGDEMWAIIASTNTILPGLTYGVTPSGATATRLPVPLSIGTEYRIVVSILDPASGQFLVTGTGSFTP